MGWWWMECEREWGEWHNGEEEGEMEFGNGWSAEGVYIAQVDDEMGED